MRFSFTKRDSWVTNGTLALHFTLTNYDNYNCWEQQVYINGNKAYLVYNKEKEPKDNDKGEGDLINKEYVMLVNILNKYKLLAYHV